MDAWQKEFKQDKNDESMDVGKEKKSLNPNKKTELLRPHPAQLSIGTLFTAIGFFLLHICGCP